VTELSHLSGITILSENPGKSRVRTIPSRLSLHSRHFPRNVASSLSAIQLVLGTDKSGPAMRFASRRKPFFIAVALCLLTSRLALADDSTGSNSPSPIAQQSRELAGSQQDQVLIPGPLRSFLRMAGISQKVPVEDVLPELAHSVSGLGFDHSGGQEHETEYLLLLRRYVRQARELQSLAGANGEIQVTRCADVGPLLRVLGYHQRGICGVKEANLTPVDPERAFLTIDSGFPLTRLEEAIQQDTSFTYPYSPSRVPVLLRATDWISLGGPKSRTADLVDVLLHDPQVAGLYWAFSKIDPETGIAMQRSIGLVNLLPYASVLDFYGTQICIRAHRVVVPGGASAETAWKDIVGVSPASPRDFVVQLIKQDKGWTALYFDSVARVDKRQQEYLTQGPRLRHLYQAFISSGTKDGAGGATFRKAPGLLLLFTRQQWLADGQPRIPGNAEVWKTILGRHGRHVSTPEQLLEAMVTASREDTDTGPLQVYLSLSEVEMARSAQKSLAPATLLEMANGFAQYSSWYSIFTEFPELNDGAISRFLHVADSLNRISKPELRGDALGIFQANIGLWQIMARQGEISAREMDASWQRIVDPFFKVQSSSQLFAAGDKSVGALMLAATGKDSVSQSELVDLLAGPPQGNVEGKRVHSEVARRMRAVMEDQRLTSLDTILQLGQGLDAMAHGVDEREKLLVLAAELRQFEMPRRIFTESEKVEWAPGVLSQRHAELEVHTDLARTIREPNTPEKLEASRGELAPFLRDTLVGLNYAYYEPPGSQLLHINPLFVRAHDFAGLTVIGEDRVWQAPTLFGTGVSAGGGAYLVGSLADLPYVLAATEQNFIAPRNVQALIWQELVPTLVANSVMARWWNVNPRELHAVALYQRSGEEILTASAHDAQLREKATGILADRMPPARLERLKTSLQIEDPANAIGRLMPADTFYLSMEFRARFPRESAAFGPANRELDTLSAGESSDVNLKHLSKDFGIPHPVLAQTYGRALMNAQPFPAFAGYCNRLFGESWDSDNLYWARLADELNDSPASLSILSPQLTRQMVSKIFATDIEDWSAVVRAMRETGDDFLQGKIAVVPGTETTAQR